ncbi:hypothetical protein FACUT_2635 [Fusarium acutatum]|uniref:Uncharacterized protein n=1 Tax=Fusarium acutatum TaxID=78861 RepID=A0A8H4K0S7_9HYPO|nr:hypothetical protein FACUT_2635 [Fusarium acutatum]
MTSRQSTGAEESQHDLRHGNRGGLAGSDSRGDQYGSHSGGQHSGGYEQAPPPPTQFSSNAMNRLPSLHYAPTLPPPPQAPDNAMNRPSTVHYEPPPPPPSATSYIYGHYPSTQPVPSGQLHWHMPLPSLSYGPLPPPYPSSPQMQRQPGHEPPNPLSHPYQPYQPYQHDQRNQTHHASYNSGNGEEGGKEKNRGKKRKGSQFDIDQGPSTDSQEGWPPRREDLSETLSPLFHYFKGTIDIEEINGSYKDSRTNQTVGFKASMSHSRINVTLNITGVSWGGPAVADAGNTAGKTAATVAGAGSSGKGPDGNSPGPASAKAS